MAKKKASPKKATPKQAASTKDPPPAPSEPLGVESTEDLHADAANPRAISDEGADGLRRSIKRFGDLAGIVFNARTGELVCGHQRMAQIKQEYGEQDIEVVDRAAGLGVIRVDNDHVFPVRVVDWSQAKQRTANVAANNQRTQGAFTDDLSSFLLEIEPEITAEMPGALDELLIVPLLDVDTPEDPKNVDIAESYSVICEVEDEEQQAEVHELLTKKGWKCRVLTT